MLSASHERNWADKNRTHEAVGFCTDKMILCANLRKKQCKASTKFTQGQSSDCCQLHRSQRLGLMPQRQKQSRQCPASLGNGFFLELFPSKSGTRDCGYLVYHQDWKLLLRALAQEQILLSRPHLLTLFIAQHRGLVILYATLVKHHGRSITVLMCMLGHSWLLWKWSCLQKQASREEEEESRKSVKKKKPKKKELSQKSHPLQPPHLPQTDC